MFGINKFFKNPYKVFSYFAIRGHFKWMNDETYLKLMFRAKMGRKLNLKNPKTYCEKLQWLKLYDRNPEYSLMVDKYRVRELVKKKIGEEYLIPILGMWEKASDIDFNSLPDQFVLKCNHDSGSVIVCRDKTTFDFSAAKEKLSNHLKKGTYYYAREWPYKNVRPCIVAEKYMEDNATNELRDYKFFTFHGVARAMFIAADRQNENKPCTFDFFDMSFNHLDIRQDHPNAATIPEKPKNFDLMRQLAEKLAENTPQLRVDFYEVNGKVYFGELTLFHHSGLVPFKPDYWDEQFGEWIDLDMIKNRLKNK